MYPLCYYFLKREINILEINTIFSNYIKSIKSFIKGIPVINFLLIIIITLFSFIFIFLMITLFLFQVLVLVKL